MALYLLETDFFYIFLISLTYYFVVNFYSYEISMLLCNNRRIIIEILNLL